MATDPEIDLQIRRVLAQILAEGGDYSGIPLVDPETGLFTPAVTNALRAPLEVAIGDLDEAVGNIQPAVASLETLVGSGRLSEPELSATYVGKGYANTFSNALAGTEVVPNRALAILNPGSGGGTALGEVVVGDGVTQAKDLVRPQARARARRHRDIARQHSAQKRLWSPPAGFNMDIWFPIFFDGLTYSTPYEGADRKHVGGNTIYVDSVNGSNGGSNDGSEALPYQSWTTAYNNAVDGDTIRFLDDGPIWRNYGPSANVNTKGVNVEMAHPDTAFFTTADLLAWTKTAGQNNVYESPRTNVRKVVDVAVDRDGFAYSRAASVAECDATPGSWYQATNGTGSVYVHTLDGDMPDPQSILALLTARLFQMESPTIPLRMHFEGVRIIGSDRGMRVASTSATNKITLTYVDCEILHVGDGVAGSSGGSGGVYNAVNVLGNVDFVAVRSRCAYSVLDGFNYHWSGGFIPQFVEIDCVAHDCGNQPNSAGAAQTQNASTAHDGVKGVRIGDKGFRTYGGIFTDVNEGTQTLNLSCDAWDSLGTTVSQGFSGQQTGVEMWLYGCRAWGNLADIYSVTGATLHVIDTEWDTKTGAGVFDIVNAL